MPNAVKLDAASMIHILAAATSLPSAAFAVASLKR